MGPQSPPTAFSINEVRVDLSSESLRGPDGGIVPVRPQAFATLRYLLQNPDRLVTKSELMRVVWHGTSVTDDSLVQCIHEIRRALKDGTPNAASAIALVEDYLETKLLQHKKPA